MALLFIEGFDHFSDATYMGAKGWNAIPTVSFQTGRVGSGQCLQQGSPSNHSNMTRALNGGATATTLFFGLGFRFSGTPSTNRSFFGFQTAAGVSCFALSLGSGNKLVVETAFNGSQVAVGTTTLTASTWFHIEGRLVINGASGSIRILLNGVEEIATTTANFGSTAAGLVVLSNEQNSFMTWSWDDIYVADSSGLAPRNSYLGDVKVETRFVTADGANTAWTASVGSDYACVDETTGPNGDTDYISSASAGDKDTFVVQDLSESSGTVFGVQTCLLARKDDAGARSVRALVRQGTTDYDCGGDHALSTSYAYVLDIWQQDPTGSDWTISNVNADEYGVKLAA
jgi:hypothetical protein